MDLYYSSANVSLSVSSFSILFSVIISVFLSIFLALVFQIPVTLSTPNNATEAYIKSIAIVGA